MFLEKAIFWNNFNFNLLDNLKTNSIEIGKFLRGLRIIDKD